MEVTDLVLGSSGPAMISLKSRLKAFLPLMPVLAPMDHTIANRNAPCMGWKRQHHKHSTYSYTRESLTKMYIHACFFLPFAHLINMYVYIYISVNLRKNTGYGFDGTMTTRFLGQYFTN